MRVCRMIERSEVISKERGNVMKGDGTEAPEDGGGRRLERVGSGRLHGGVCAGLAEYTGVDVALFRLGAIALALLGGAGITLYLAAWLLIPNAVPSARSASAYGRHGTSIRPAHTLPSC